MTFGEAVESIKDGGKVAREGWNGKNMFIYLMTFTPCENGVINKPCIAMYTASGEHQPGWLASQADMLADDWVEV